MSGVSALEFLLVAAGLGCVVVLLLGQGNDVVVVQSSVDSRRYIVRNLPDRQEAADMIGSIVKDLSRLVEYMYKLYPADPDVRRLVRNFSPDSVSESAPNDLYTSYSVNKGERIVLCLRSRDAKQEMQPRNVLMYVAIHELAHLMTAEVGHVDTFWENDKRLLEHAIRLGIYEKQDFAAAPVKYCGIKITTSVV
jgi:hypothetical protein